jgi:hypothetical protein
MTISRPRVVLVQLPIPPVAPYATIVWRGGDNRQSLTELDPREIVMA